MPRRDRSSRPSQAQPRPSCADGGGGPAGAGVRVGASVRVGLASQFAHRRDHVGLRLTTGQWGRWWLPLATSFDCGSGTPGSVPAGLILDGLSWGVNPPSAGTCWQHRAGHGSPHPHPHEGDRANPCYSDPPRPEWPREAPHPASSPFVYPLSQCVPRLTRRGRAWSPAPAPPSSEHSLSTSPPPISSTSHARTPPKHEAGVWGHPRGTVEPSGRGSRMDAGTLRSCVTSLCWSIAWQPERGHYPLIGVISLINGSGSLLMADIRVS